MDQSEHGDGQSAAASFDTIDHAHLQHFLDQRVTDGVVRKMIDKWLKTGRCSKRASYAARLAERHKLI
jgi:hypothetical protein